MPNDKKKPKQKLPYLTRVRNRVRKKLIGGGKGTTLGTQAQQIKELGLMDEDEFGKMK